MPRLIRDGYSINYKDSGTGDPTLIFSHGFFMDLTMFDHQINEFSEKFRCIAWDERGFGGSTASDYFSYWDSADDLIALLDHLNVEEAILVGMSKGGFISLRAAINYPDRVRAVVLIGSDSLALTKEEKLEFEEILSTWCNSDNIDELSKDIGALLFGDNQAKSYWIDKWKYLDRSNIKYPAQALLDREDITERLNEIQCPLLNIHGTEDKAIPISNAENLTLKMLHGARLVTIEGAPHSPNITHPAETNSAIFKFVEDLEQS